MISVVTCLLVGLGAPSESPAAPKPEARVPEQIVVHLSKGLDNPHAALMALKLGTALLQQGAKVVLMLDLEGVRVVDARLAADARYGEGDDVAKTYDAFTKAGGIALLCPHCAAAAGLAAVNLRAGARLATENELANLITKASKIIDY